MTIAMPLKRIAEEALSDKRFKSLSGQVQSYEDLLNVATLAAIDAAHDGVFGLMVYDRELDTSIAEYVGRGGLDHDTTQSLLVLYPADPSDREEATETRTAIPGVNISERMNPTYEWAREVLSEGPEPTLPGIVLLERLSINVEPVFISAAGLSTKEEVRDVLRESFRCASAAAQLLTPGKFANELCVALAKSTVSKRYIRSGSLSVKEALIQLWRALLDNRQDFMTVAGLF